MRNIIIRSVVLAAGLLGAVAAQAAGIDCSKARSATEKAICANPNLLALDQKIAEAYADALQRQPDQRDAMRQDLIRWLNQRDSACALPSAQIPRCMSGQMQTRLAALAPPVQQAAPTQPQLPATPGKLETSTAPARPADPTLPPGNLSQAAAHLDQTSLPAADHAQTLLHVTTAGRFSIVAKSGSGAALQLVDQMAGPGDWAGAAGSQDGRLDPLLDAGTYRINVASAKGASGSVVLTVTPFHDAALSAALPPPGFPLTTTLRDGEQRAFWLVVPPDGQLRIEAAGRALGDLRLWRDGRELAALDPAALRVEPVSGHPLTDLRLVGKVEPGTYLAVAYGGAPNPWTDGDASQPLYVRNGASPTLAEGWAGGPMGPFGSEIYAVPPALGLLRLTLPASATAELRVGETVAAISRTSREPTVHIMVNPKQTPIVEVRATAGQAFTLQGSEQPPSRVLSRPGTYWVSAVVNGAGGDEIPPTVLLERSEGAGKPDRVIGGTVPRVGPGTAWHSRFNLRGPTMLLVQNTAGGELGVRTTGVAIRQRGQPGVANLPADYYGLTLTPDDGAMGSLDLIVGAPGAATPALTPWPADPVVPLGVQTVGAGQVLRLSGPDAPGVQFGLTARRLPVALAEGPLTVTQAPGTSVAVPVMVAAGGSLAVSEVGGGPILYGLQDAGAGAQTVVVPIADHARTIALAWRRTVTVAPIPPPAPQSAAVAVAAGAPAFFDLGADESRGFAVTVPEGGLYRVETTGRLHTAGRIATAFIPNLGQAEANGVGQNMLLQAILRAGRYRVDVSAKDSGGHLGLSVAQASVLTGATLVPGGSVRASLPAGSAIRFPLQVSGPGERYHLEVASLGAPWQGRIEDTQGWPVTKTGPLDGTDAVLPPGQYHLVINPDVVARQVVARLTAIVKVPEITGHGPHALPFEAEQSAVWREPEAGQSREPDVWTFDLAGPAAVTLTLGDGMTGDLRREGGDAPIRVVGKYAGTLQAGQYQLIATSLGRNDRLAYTVLVSSEALQPGIARNVTLPATVRFAIAAARVVSLTSFGNQSLKGVLRRADGGVVARIGPRTDDWNIAASRLLPAGNYKLELATASPPDLNRVTVPGAPAASSDDSSSSDDDSGDKPADDQQAQSAPTPPSSDDNTPATDGDAPAPTTELRLALPEALPAAPAPETKAALTGSGVHVLTLAQPKAGTLVVAQAASSAAVVLTLERQDDKGWRLVGLSEGTTPVVTSPADDGAAAWRVEAWTVDGGAEPIRLAARAVDVPTQSGTVDLAAVDGMPGPVAVGHVGLESAAPVTVNGPAGLLVGGWAGQALTTVNGPVLPQDRDVWLLSSAPGTAKVVAVALQGEQAMMVPPGQSASLPAWGPYAVWRAEGGFGQPGLGAAAGIAQFSAVARADAPVVLRNAGNGDALRVSLTRLDLKALPVRTLDAPLQVTLPPGAALPVTLPTGDKAVLLNLGAGVAAFADGTAVWGGAAPVSRSLTGAWTQIVLANTGTLPAPAGLLWQAEPAALLKPGAVLKRFFGAAGSFEQRFEAPAGATLNVAGPATLTVVAADGTVWRGSRVAVAGTGRVVVEHMTAPVALWIAAPGNSPWPPVNAQTVVLPAQMALNGPAMGLAWNQAAPSLLHVSTSAPVLVALQQAGRIDPPRLFAAGAELHVMLAAGAAELRLYSPTDGPLTGSMAVSAEPVIPVTEGLGAPVMVAPGGSAAFGFSLAKAATIGVGVRADPDRATVRLLDATGTVKGQGVAELLNLPAGQYVIEAQVPPNAPPTVLRPAVIGITPRGNEPPPDVIQHYLELVGMKPQGTAP